MQLVGISRTLVSRELSATYLVQMESSETGVEMTFNADIRYLNNRNTTTSGCVACQIPFQISLHPSTVL